MDKEIDMPAFKHEHLGQHEPRSHGETHNGRRIMTSIPPRKARLPIRPWYEPGKTLCERRPFRSWQDIDKVSSFGPGMAIDVKGGGAQIGSRQST